MLLFLRYLFNALISDFRRVDSKCLFKILDKSNIEDDLKKNQLKNLTKSFSKPKSVGKYTRCFIPKQGTKVTFGFRR